MEEEFRPTFTVSMGSSTSPETSLMDKTHLKETADFFQLVTSEKS
jgi:hypothetical protein